MSPSSGHRWSAAQRWLDLRRQWRLLARHARFGRASFGRTPNDIRTAQLGHLFRLVNAHLRVAGVPYALGYGTLLGWHREKRILAHDYDVDFLAPLEAYPAIRAVASALPAGLRLHDTSQRHRGPKLYLDWRGWEADIYFFAERDGLLHSTEICVNPGDVAPFPREYLWPAQPATFLGEPTFVPARPVELLTHHYRYLGADAVRDPVTRYFRPRNP